MNKPWILIIKRIIYSVFLLFLVSSFVFVLLRISPGDPVSRYISPELNSHLADQVRSSFGLNEPVFIQYINFLAQTFTGNLGVSFNYREPVVKVISEFLPFTFIFGLVSFTLQMVIAVSLSLWAAKRKGSRSDKIISNTNIILYSVPSFFLGVLLVFVFSGLFHILPSSGLKSYNNDQMGFLSSVYDYAKHMFLPLITLTLTGTTVLYRYLRENMDEIFNSGFVLFLRSNGVPEKKIIRNNILPNALSPLIAIAGIELGILFSGTLITEVIFGLPGMGRLTVQAILVRDYPLVTGCALVSGALIIICNFAADIFKYKMDKRLLSKGILD